MNAAPRARVQRRPVHGVLLLDKPLGLSSNQALQKAKWLLRAEKAGHTGTLDPLATGVLPLCFGAATKFSGLHLDADKTYRATLQLGVRTSTGDREGEVIERRPVPPITAELLESVRQRFLGRVTQIPPMHSALKKDGKPLYDYARAGVEVERSARDIVIHELNLALPPDGQAQTAIEMIVKCSKGTYIRTLGEDIGEALGCGGHLSALRRTAVGGFSEDNAATIEQLAEPGALAAALLPADAAVAHLAQVSVSETEAARLLHGQAVPGADVAPAGPARVYGPDDRFLGIVAFDAQRRVWRPQKMLAG